MSVLRACLDCGSLSSAPRCLVHRRAQAQAREQHRGSRNERGYDSEWRRLARAVVQAHMELYGYVCPGWQRPAHAAMDLTADHDVPLAHGGASSDGNVGVLCRTCNSAKGGATRGRGGRNLEGHDGATPLGQASRAMYGSGAQPVAPDPTPVPEVA